MRNDIMVVYMGYKIGMRGGERIHTLKLRIKLPYTFPGLPLLAPLLLLTHWNLAHLQQNARAKNTIIKKFLPGS